jgi:hypothetical protein
MEKRRVVFKLNNSRGGDWQIQVFCPDRKIEYVVGFKVAWKSLRFLDHLASMRLLRPQTIESGRLEIVLKQPGTQNSQTTC